MIERLTLLVVVALLSACAGTRQVPEDSFYRLDIEPPAAMAPALAPALTGNLSVQVGATAPLYRDRALLYSEARQPGRLQRYHYHYWVDSPPRLVQRGLAAYLRAAAVAPGVVTPEDAVDTRYRLRVDIERFEHRRAGAGGAVHVGLALTLSEPGAGRLLSQDHLVAEVAVRGAAHADLVAAYRQALQTLYADVLTRLRASAIAD
ncbi:MAG: ABC-type transport auxiliary lipoprotein family protein [Gammaproteobacteria bacterium]